MIDRRTHHEELQALPALALAAPIIGVWLRIRIKEALTRKKP